MPKHFSRTASIIDTWDHADICYTETYNVDPAGVHFSSVRSNWPDLAAIAKAATYARAKDMQALLGYTLNRGVAESLIQTMPEYVFKEDIVIKRRPANRETVDFLVDGKIVAVFDLQQERGQWLVCGMSLLDKSATQ